MNSDRVKTSAAGLGIALWIFFWWAFYTWKNRVLLNVYPSLFLPWAPSANYPPAMDLIIATGTMLLYCLPGALVLRLYDTYIPMPARAALSFLLGLGTMALLGEALGFTGFFHGAGAAIGYALLCLILLAAGIARHVRREATRDSGGGNPWVRITGHQVAMEAYGRTIMYPAGFQEMALYTGMTAATAICVLLWFYHGLFYPITYWDSFSYLGMARTLYLTHRFPVSVVSQMSLGTGSNYPQMYRIASALPCALAGRWTDVPAQMLAPVAGLFSAALIYHTVLRLFRHRLTASCCALLFCCIPYVTRYFTFSSDYCLTVLFTAGFLYLSLMYLESGLWGYLALSAITAAFSCHINYLMPLLFVGWFFLIFLCHAGKTRLPGSGEENAVINQHPDVPGPTEVHEPEFTHVEHVSRLFALLFSRRFLKLFVILILLASPWYLRNILVTGNPVYPYFSSLLGGRNIRSDILRSMQGEWLENGDGIEKAALTLLAQKISSGDMSDRDRNSWIKAEDEHGVQLSLKARILATPYFFITSPYWSWALAPLFLSLALPGFILWTGKPLIRLMRRWKSKGDAKEPFLTDEARFGLLCAFLFAGYFGYHYLMAGYYLYQILPVVVMMALMAAGVIGIFPGSRWKNTIFIWSILVAIVPGIPFAMMNFKLSHAVSTEYGQETPMMLAAMRRPGMHKDKFLEWVFGDDIRMTGYINANMKNEVILTHDNRFLLYDPSIRIINMDDAEVQKTWEMISDEDRLKAFRDIGVRYYLRIGMEEKHQILQRAGLSDWESKGYLLRRYQAGDNVLFKFAYKSIMSPDEQTFPDEDEVIINVK